MSAFVASSVINKSGKKFAPKAPARRAGPGSAASGSARASVDRQTPSRASQPPPTRPATAAPSSTIPQPSAPSSSVLPPREQPIAHSQTVTAPVQQEQAEARATSIPTPVGSLAATQRTTEISQSGQDQHHRPADPPSVTLQDSATTTEADEPQIASQRPAVEAGKTSSVSALGKRKAASSRATGANSVPVGASPRSAKRRKTTSGNVSPSGPEVGTEHLTTNGVSANNTQSENRIAPDGASDNIPTRKATGKRKRPTAEASTTENAQNADGERATETTRPRSRRARAPARNRTVDDVAADIVADAVGERPAKRRPGRRRAKTPDNAENMEIAPTTVTMSDLCRGSQAGKKSERETKLQELAAAKEEEKRKRKEERARRTEEGEHQRSSVDPSPTPEIPSQGQPPQQEQQPLPGAVPETTVVNGQIVLVNSSLVIDRHANAAGAAGEVTTIDETGRMDRITSSSHAKWAARSRTKNWDDEDVELFYKGLRIFGTDFGVISKMFPADPTDPESGPGRTRRQIKSKYGLEERRNPQRIHEALLGPREVVNMEQVTALTNTVYQAAAEVTQAIEEEARNEEQRRGSGQVEQPESAAEVPNDENAENNTPERDSVTANTPEENRETALAQESVATATSRKKKAKKAVSTKKRPPRKKKATAGTEEVLGSIEDLQR